MQHFKFVIGKSYGKAHCELGWNWSPEPLIDYDLWYAVSGKGDMVLNGTSYSISKGTCFLLRPGDQPQATQDPSDRLHVMFIHFSISMFDHSTIKSPITARPPFCTRIEETFYIESLINRMLETLELNDPWIQAEFDSIMKQVWILLFRTHYSGQLESKVSAKQSQLISQVTRTIRDMSGKRIDHTKLAEMVQLSPQYLSKLFTRCVGVSIKEYITQERLKRAMYLLTETSMNVSQVSDALEYTNIYAFSKQFKKYYNEPPSKFLMKSIASKPHK